MSELRTDTITASDGTSPVTLTKQAAARAWVNFNGTGTVAARDSLNVSGLLDNGPGEYTVNFSNAFGTVNYASTGNSWSTGSTGFLLYGSAQADPTTSASRFTTSSTTAFGDTHIIGISFNGDLA
tara:strand:- start:213 stop:587 length:375 start_codon:yes stop_codon:yes gene_type:complete